MGHDNCVLPSHLRPLDPTLKVAGMVWTVSGHIDRTRSAHDTLVCWTTLLSKAPSGHVVVCQPHNQEIALMGELPAETLKDKGVLGYVVDGGCRDTDCAAVAAWTPPSTRGARAPCIAAAAPSARRCTDRSRGTLRPTWRSPARGALTGTACRSKWSGSSAATSNAASPAFAGAESTSPRLRPCPLRGVRARFSDCLLL